MFLPSWLPVSIPFIAGQWSLLAGYTVHRTGMAHSVSIPFIAGQWSLLVGTVADSFDKRFMFQSPSLRGSGRFESTGFTSGNTTSSFNPLHCGAVVASWPGGPEHRPRRPSFNPLHCGAVVASRRAAALAAMALRVSIPFIAGQWSLRAHARHPRRTGVGFQSPSLRGSGRFDSIRRRILKLIVHVSIPFIAGQWSLPQARAAKEVEARKFQSPSLRGSGRFLQRVSEEGTGAQSFNPLHCGAVVASPR